MRLFVRRLHNNKYDNGKYNKLVLAIVLHQNYGHKYQHYYKCKISSISMPFWQDNVQVFDALETIFHLRGFRISQQRTWLYSRHIPEIKTSYIRI